MVQPEDIDSAIGSAILAAHRRARLIWALSDRIPSRRATALFRGDPREVRELQRVDLRQEPAREERLQPPAQTSPRELRFDDDPRAGPLMARLDRERRPDAAVGVRLDEDTSRAPLRDLRAQLPRRAHEARLVTDGRTGADAAPSDHDEVGKVRVRKDARVAVAVIGDETVDDGGRRVD